MKLIKLSEPGWEIEYQDKFELQAKLYTCICNRCRREEGITRISNPEHMLATPCGCEYDIE